MNTAVQRILANRAGDKNVKNLLTEAKKAGLRLKSTGDGYYDLFSIDPGKAKMLKLVKVAGWKPQGPALFPDKDGIYYVEAPNGTTDDSQGYFNFNDGEAMISSEGNW